MSCGSLVVSFFDFLWGHGGLTFAAPKRGGRLRPGFEFADFALEQRLARVLLLALLGVARLFAEQISQALLFQIGEGDRIRRAVDDVMRHARTGLFAAGLASVGRIKPNRLHER